ncbi:hypothetical protein [Cohnella thermotolerans]|jgi:hypothetical protein|uniref:hypothetical protein n=1 Tax=Cohnella thermotolerans TaxID=329858 RepID=UPI0004265D97|nr:hypothetical protein [Cohnella thermotolerans]
MTLNRPKPANADSKKSKVVKFVAVRKPKARQTPTFTRLTVVWVQNNGVPFDTTGFFATLTRSGQVVSTASFDSFGVVRFANVSTLTQVSYTLRVFNSDGTLFRTRTIPNGVETFAIIG